MLELQLPWVLLALPLPYFVWRFSPPHTETVEALRVPYFARIAELTGASPQQGAVIRRRAWWRLVLLIFVWIATVLALTRPTLRGAPITTTQSARDLMLAVDLSGSMDTRDMTDATGKDASRLTVVKEVVSDFALRRQGDRLGLMVFGAAPYLQAPFTLDSSLVTRLLGDAQTRMAGDSTALGDAIGLTIRTFDRSKASNRVLILLTDGNDTGSDVPPETAARIAADRGITIHVVGVGDPTLVGEERLNEDLLRSLAQITGGRYFHADDREQLAQIYAELDRLEAIQFESQTYIPQKDVYIYPLGVAAVLVGLLSIVVAVSGGRLRVREGT